MYIESSVIREGGSTDGSDDLPVEHLQLRPHIIRALREFGVTSVGSAAAFTRRPIFKTFPNAADVATCIAALDEARTDGVIDWPRYWALRGWQLHHLSAFLDPLQRLSDSARDIPVDRTTFGNAGAMLRASGITTLGMLVDGLVRGLGDVRGLGRGKLVELFRSLVQLCERIDDAGDISPAVEPQAPKALLIWPDISAAVRELPISILHIGQKSTWLTRAGYSTVGRLVDAGPSQLARLSAVGPRTVRTITERLEQLAACSKGGELNLENYCEASGLVLIPNETISGGEELLEALPRVIAGLARELPDDVYRTILAERLCKSPRDQRTLAEIGQQCVPPITRERVRQKEKKLLTQLAASLIWSRDNELGIHFHPSFTALWKAAAFEFAGIEEIGFDEFITRLSSVWNVPPGELTPHLPLITALVTGEPQMPVAFRAGLRLAPRLLGDLPSATLNVRLEHLRLGKQCDRLEARGVTLLGEAIILGKQGVLTQKVINHLGLVAQSLTPAGFIDWHNYADLLELKRVPEEAPAEAAQFASQFVSVVVKILHDAKERWARIFELRTSRPLAGRPTLEAVAQTLGSYGPHIKNEETELLQHLHDVLVDGCFSSLNIWIDAEWLSWVRSASEVFRTSLSQYDLFEASLALRWGVGTQVLQPALPALWAILTGYPQGRRRKVEPAGIRFEPAVPIEPAKIRLTGFRRVH